MVGPVVLVVALAMVTGQVLRAWSVRFAAPDRYVLVSAGVEAVVALAAVRAVAPPPVPLSWLWVVAVGAVGFGLAGAVLRWPTLGWAPTGEDGPDRGVARRRAALAAVYAVIGAGALVVLA
ncbi:hypothetical protein CFP66_08765 [Pseudonocardia sp. MH-G8]|nr:hypothetical protein CFP66_08765 [Pseudonocardia sp. MH-G8]